MRVLVWWEGEGAGAVGVGGCWCDGRVLVQWEGEGAGVMGGCWCGGSVRVLVWWEGEGAGVVGGCWCSWRVDNSLDMISHEEHCKIHCYQQTGG